MTSRLELKTFPFPKNLEPDLIRFYLQQPSFELRDLQAHAEKLSKYVGVYFLYYMGQSPLYEDIARMNTTELVKAHIRRQGGGDGQPVRQL